MYKCEICNSLIQKKIKSYRVITLFRRKVYPVRKGVIWGPDPKNPRKYKWNDDPGGKGFEILEEKTACPDCDKKVIKPRKHG